MRHFKPSTKALYNFSMIFVVFKVSGNIVSIAICGLIAEPINAASTPLANLEAGEPQLDSAPAECTHLRPYFAWPRKRARELAH